MSHTPEEFEAYKNMNDAFMSAYFRPIRNVYIDFECCFDFKLGAILQHMITTDVEYQYILSKLPDYERALDLETAKYFPALGFTEEQVMEVVNKYKHTKELTLGSPPTEWWSKLSSTIVGINSTNSNKVSRDTKLTLFFHSKLVDPPQETQDILTHSIQKTIDPTVEVRFVSGGINNQEEEFVMNTDYFVVYDIVDFFMEGGVCAKLGKDDVFMTKTILTRVQVQHQDNVIERLENQILMMLGVCDFAFIRNKIITRNEE